MGKKFEVREKKGPPKIWELDSNNRDVDRDSSDESDIDESLDSLRPIEILSMHSCSAALSFIRFLCPATLVLGVVNGKCATLQDCKTSAFLCEPKTYSF